MRIFFLLLFLAGLAIGFVWPRFAADLTGREIGIYEVYDPAAGFKPVTAPLTADGAPVRVSVELTTAHEAQMTADRPVLTLTVAQDGRTLLAEPITFAEEAPRQESPQSPRRIYMAEAGTIADPADGDAVFTLGSAEAEGVEIETVRLMLSGGAVTVDPRALPIGLTLIAIGFIGFVVSFRRRPPANRNSQPPQPRWGRGGDGRA